MAVSLHLILLSLWTYLSSGTPNRTPHLQNCIYFRPQEERWGSTSSVRSIKRWTSCTNLYDVAHDACAVETFRWYGHSDISLHLALCSHLLQFVLLRLQFALVFKWWFGHVGQEMPEFHIFPPCLLVPNNYKMQHSNWDQACARTKSWRQYLH